MGLGVPTSSTPSSLLVLIKTPLLFQQKKARLLAGLKLKVNEMEG
jgi:hypothetical protein